MKNLLKAIAVLICISIVIMSCDNNSNTSETTTNTPIVEIEYDTILTFEPEMKVDWFSLRIPENYYQSFKEYIEGGQRFKPDTLDNQNRVVGFLSFNRDEKLELIMYPSDSSYSFSVIELRKSTKEEAAEDSGFFGLYKDPLKTGNGLRIGSTKADVIAKTGDPMKVSTTEKGEQLEYWVEGQHILLKGHETNKYFLVYDIVNGKVDKIRFGFE